VIEHEDIARYLLDRSLIDTAAVLDGKLAISDASSRNRNFKVTTADGPSYLLKQPGNDGNTWSLANEATAYHWISTEAPAMAPYMPAFYGFDPEHGMLVLQLLTPVQSMRAVQTRSGRFEPGPAAQLGAALGVLHRSTADLPADDGWRAATPAWTLSIDRPDASLFRDVSAAGLELITIVQSAEGFPAALDRLRAEWRRTALIHGDVKWDNCMCTEAADGGYEVRLIDWEGAMRGDPAWDIGSALSQYLSCWLFSIPVTGGVPPERFPELADYPLDSMKRALVACWGAYVEARELDARAAAAELIRAVELAGVRLVQTAYESAQFIAQLTSASILHLQLGLNVMTRPQEAATDLLGIGARAVTAR
jgi:aminoglycoside phosphotransferase (APT) family kinase protein